MERLRRRGGTVRDLLKGALAGAVATGIMDRVTAVLYERESRRSRRQEDAARGGVTAYEVAAEKAASLVGSHLTNEDRHRLGNAVHWALGIAAGAAYGTLRHKVPGLRTAGGAKFGMAFWATVDEGLVSILGVTPPPQAFPVEAHARGLVGHLVFGIVADRTLRVLDNVA